MAEEIKTSKKTVDTVKNIKSSTSPNVMLSRFYLAAWPFLITLVPVGYVCANAANFKIQSSISGFSALGVYLLLLPAIIAGILLFINKTGSICLAHISMFLGGISAARIPWNDYTKLSDWVYNTPLLSIKRIWGYDELREAILSVLTGRVQFDYGAVDKLIKAAAGSISQARRLAGELVQAPVVIPPKIEAAVQLVASADVGGVGVWLSTNLPIIAVTAIGTLIAGAGLNALSRWLFGDPLATLKQEVVTLKAERARLQADLNKLTLDLSTALKTRENDLLGAAAQRGSLSERISGLNARLSHVDQSLIHVDQELGLIRQALSSTLTASGRPILPAM